MAAEPMVEPRRFTVEEYERMGKVGIIDPAERVELLDGEIVAMSPIGRSTPQLLTPSPSSYTAS